MPSAVMMGGVVSLGEGGRMLDVGWGGIVTPTFQAVSGLLLFGVCFPHSFGS